MFYFFFSMFDSYCFLRKLSCEISFYAQKMFTIFYLKENKTQNKSKICTLPSFKKGNIEDGRVKVDKLKQVHFDGQRILVFRVCLVIFLNTIISKNLK